MQTVEAFANDVAGVKAAQIAGEQVFEQSYDFDVVTQGFYDPNENPKSLIGSEYTRSPVRVLHRGKSLAQSLVTDASRYAPKCTQVSRYHQQCKVGLLP